MIHDLRDPDQIERMKTCSLPCPSRFPIAGIGSIPQESLRAHHPT